jgi:hypothetical protein
MCVRCAVLCAVAVVRTVRVCCTVDCLVPCSAGRCSCMGSTMDSPIAHGNCLTDYNRINQPHLTRTTTAPATISRAPHSLRSQPSRCHPTHDCTGRFPARWPLSAGQHHFGGPAAAHGGVQLGCRLVHRR